ncbi:hypothetical protein Tco_1187715, partial [Tanacetum coccineum]
TVNWGVGWLRTDSNSLGFDHILLGPCVLLSNCGCGKGLKTLLGKDTGTRGTLTHELGSSWAMEVGNDMKVVTNGQMLVEEGIHFIEIANAIRSLGLVDPN